jgi:hypothetical protein
MRWCCRLSLTKITEQGVEVGCHRVRHLDRLGHQHRGRVVVERRRILCP